MAIGLLGQKLIPKIGRYALSLGAAIMAAGLIVTYLFVARSGIDTTPWEFIPGLLITGAGMGLIMAPIYAVVLTDVDPKHAGSASGVLNAAQQLGGAIGIAIIGVVFFGQLTQHSNASFTSAEPNIRSELTKVQVPSQLQSSIVDGVRTCFNDRSKQTDATATPESCKKFETSSQNPINKKIGQIVSDAVKNANSNNFINAFKVGVIYELVLIVTTFVLSFLLPRHIRPEVLQQGH